MVSPRSNRSLQRGKRLKFQALEFRRMLATLGGQVFVDANGNGELDSGEHGIAKAVVYLDRNNNGLLDQSGFRFDPDDFVDGQVLNHATQVIAPSATATNNIPAFRVIAKPDPAATTGDLVFGHDGTTWENNRRLRFDLSVPARSFSIDVVGATTGRSDVRLDAFTRLGALISSNTRTVMGNGASSTLTIERTRAEINYVVAYVTSSFGSVKFDHARVDQAGSERSALTASDGTYQLDDVAPGRIHVAQQVPAGFTPSSPANRAREIVVGSNSVFNVNFGNRTGTLRGTVFDDAGAVGVFDEADRVRPGAAVYVDVNQNGSPDTADVSVQPSLFVAGQVLDYVAGGIRLSTVDSANESVNEFVTATTTIDDAKVFAHENDTAWTRNRRLRIDLPTPASKIQIDFIGDNERQTERGVLIAFDRNGQAIDTLVGDPVAMGKRTTLAIDRNANDIAYAVAYTLDADAAGTGMLDVLSVTMVSEPTVFSAANGNYVFTPLAAGDYRVSVVPSDAYFVSLPSAGFHQREIRDTLVDEVLFGLVDINQPPLAQNDAVSTNEDTAVAIDVLANDQDTNGTLNSSSVVISLAPLHGTVEVGEDGIVTYTPNANFFGSDSFIYTIRDQQGARSNGAAVSIVVIPVNDAPVAANDTAVAVRGSSSVISVLDNDSDIDSEIDPASLTLVRTPAHGVAVIDALTGTITYTPDQGFVGTDTLRYFVSDVEGLASNVATVELAVVDSGTPPVATEDFATTAEGTPVFIDVAANDADLDGIVVPATVAITATPSHGTATINRATGRVEYRPTLGFVGTDTFRYIVRDNSGLASNAAAVSITITEREFPWQNPLNMLDVNGDGAVTPRDALWIISEINTRQVSRSNGEIIANPVPPNRPSNYLDVTGDGFIVPGDVLRVISYLNARSRLAIDPPQLAVVAAAFSDLDDEAWRSSPE